MARSTAEHEHEAESGGAGFATNLRDLILGGQDGMVNVLGLVLGLTAAGSDLHVILAGGLAALLAESIAMGGVQYTSSTAERGYYEARLAHKRREIAETPEVERAAVRTVFEARGLHGELLDQIVAQITADPERWVQVAMQDGLKLAEPSSDRLLTRAALVGISCAVGSAIPLLPYLVLPLGSAPSVAVAICAVVLFGAGAYKAVTLVGSWWRSGAQMLTIGLASAFAGYLIGVLLHQ